MLRALNFSMQQKQTVKFVNKDKSLFYQTVKANVNQYFTDNHISKYGNAKMFFKSFVLLTAYLGAFALILIFNPPFYISLLLWFSMGISVAGVGMSVMHDANHGAYSENKYVNAIMGYTLNLLGGTVHNWKLQHNILHHTYTNITGLDDDIDDKAGMRFSPHNTWKPKHNFQYVYAFFLYGLITLYWCVAKDFVQFSKYTNNGVNANTKSQNIIMFIKLIILKAGYFFLFLVMPTLYFDVPFIQILTGFLVMHFVGGMILSVVFQLAHTVEDTTHPMPTDEGTIENCWAIHQMNTTMNFSRKNKLLSWYVGGLNFQVEHHLFPKICHVHYPEIAPIVKATAESFGVPYLENKTFGIALGSHVKTLKRLGKMPVLDDIMG
jgi:linoleoyl-CoA desaturase